MSEFQKLACCIGAILLVVAAVRWAISAMTVKKDDTAGTKYTVLREAFEREAEEYPVDEERRLE